VLFRANCFLLIG